MVNVRYIKVRSLLSPTKLGADFVINPYVGCPHGCRYCYAPCVAHSQREREEPWGQYLDVKRPSVPIEPAKIFRKDILLSSMTDPYNPYEERSQVTRDILRSLLPAQPNITILTKSALVVRDIDIFRKFPHVKVIFSFSSLNDGFRRVMEPHASAPARKMEALAALHEAGVETSVMAAPIFPAITECSAIIESAARYVSQMNFDGLNLRSRNKESMLSLLGRLYPHLRPLYHDIYINGRKDYWQALRREIEASCQMSGIKHNIFF